jgi:hypothetical protein
MVILRFLNLTEQSTPGSKGMKQFLQYGTGGSLGLVFMPIALASSTYLLARPSFPFLASSADRRISVPMRSEAISFAFLGSILRLDIISPLIQYIKNVLSAIPGPACVCENRCKKSNRENPAREAHSRFRAALERGIRKSRDQQALILFFNKILFSKKMHNYFQLEVNYKQVNIIYLKIAS